MVTAAPMLPGTPASTTGREAAQLALIGQRNRSGSPNGCGGPGSTTPLLWRGSRRRPTGARVAGVARQRLVHRARLLPCREPARHVSTWHRARARWFAMRTVTERWACGDGSSRRTSTSGSGRDPREQLGTHPGTGADRRFGVACGRACPFSSARPKGENIVGCSTALRAQQGPVSVPTSGNGM